MPRPVPKILFQSDFKPKKGIKWARQTVNRKIRKKEFPPPDGKTSDAPSAPNWWWETTIDKYLIKRAAALREARRTSPPVKIGVKKDCPTEIPPAEEENETV
jgi:hypothetical protein